MKIDTLQLKDRSIRYFRFGDPEGQPMVIIPGVALKSVMLSAMFIEKQYQDFADAFNVFVFDRRMDMPAHYSIKSMAEDICQALDSLSIRSADIYGVSQGGMIAQCIAVDRPDPVRKLVLCSTSGYVPPTASAVFQEWSSLTKAQNIEGLVLSFAKNVYSQSYFEKNRDAFIQFGRTVTEDELQRFYTSLACFDACDLRNELHRIQSPVLVIGGEQDRIFGAESAKEIAKHTNGKLILYPNDAHAVYDENPDVMKRIRSFLDA